MTIVFSMETSLSFTDTNNIDVYIKDSKRMLNTDLKLNKMINEKPIRHIGKLWSQQNYHIGACTVQKTTSFGKKFHLLIGNSLKIFLNIHQKHLVVI